MGLMNLISRYDLEKFRNKWVLKIVLAFVLAVTIFSVWNQAVGHYNLSDEYLRVGALIIGVQRI